MITRTPLDEPIPDARLTAPLDPPATGTITVAFLISPEAELVDFAGPWGVFEYVHLDDGHNSFALYTVAATTEPVRISGGMVLVPGHDVESAPAPDIVVVPAIDMEKVAPETLDWLRRVHHDTAVTMSVCNGSFVLGQAGLLDGKTATSHHAGYTTLRALFPEVTVVRGRRYVEDGKIATAGGLTAGTDLALRRRRAGRSPSSPETITTEIVVRRPGAVDGRLGALGLQPPLQDSLAQLGQEAARPGQSAAVGTDLSHHLVQHLLVEKRRTHYPTR